MKNKTPSNNKLEKQNLTRPQTEIHNQLNQDVDMADHEKDRYGFYP
jgi:hypothetical protein